MPKRTAKRKYAEYKAYSFAEDEQDPVIDAIRVAMATQERTVRSLAQASGVSPSTITKWLNRNTRRPTFSTIAAAGSALGYSGFDWRARKLIGRRNQ